MSRFLGCVAVRLWRHSMAKGYSVELACAPERAKCRVTPDPSADSIVTPKKRRKQDSTSKKRCKPVARNGINVCYRKPKRIVGAKIHNDPVAHGSNNHAPGGSYGSMPPTSGRKQGNKQYCLATNWRIASLHGEHRTVNAVQDGAVVFASEQAAVTRQNQYAAVYA